MHPEVRSAIEKIWEQERDQEYDIIGEIFRNTAFRSKTLDVGCGYLGMLFKEDKLEDSLLNSFGVDIDFMALSKNSKVKNRICADAHNLPFKTEIFDIIVCRWLLEHLKHPDIAMKEFARVLNKGGYLYAKTPNLLNYAMFISKNTPLRFHNFIRKLSKEGLENSPTYYRANTNWKLKKLALQNGFEIKNLIFRTYSFMYYSFSKHLFFIMRNISSFVSKFFPYLRLQVIVLMKKMDD